MIKRIEKFIRKIKRLYRGFSLLVVSPRETISDWYWRNFKNPYKIDIQGYCPRQSEGILKTGEFYYFRARGSRVSIDICENESYWFKHEYLFRKVWEDYKPWPECGGLSERECIMLATEEINNYYKEKNI